MKHRAVFFDLGGTLFSYTALGNRIERMLDLLAERRRIDASRDQLMGAYRNAMLASMAEFHARPFYLHRELFADAHARFLRGFGLEASAGDLGPFSGEDGALGEAEIRARDDAAATLAALRGRGLHVSVVSNIDDDQLEAVWPRVGADLEVDAITTSEEARSCKPDPGIYRLALEKAGGPPPESVVFVGDSVAHDVAGANALGMTSVLIGAAPADAQGARAPDHTIERLGDLLAIVRS